MSRRRSIAPLAVAFAAALAPGLLAQEQAPSARADYDKYCAQCHGEKGDGRGISAPRVLPAPRDFTTGKFKFRTTPSGSLPADDDLRRVIRQGLPHTTMPGWPDLSDAQVDQLIATIKSFSPAFADPERKKPPIEIPDPPASSAESVQRGRQVYEEQGCVRCHGDLGRGDGPSAPTLMDDWGQPIRPADLTMPWTFRGGPTRQDVYRTFSTGVNGTPMPSYADSLKEEQRWDLTNYIHSLSPTEDASYAELVRAHHVEDELDLAAAATLFDAAPEARFPLVGQIIQPGRNFNPSVSSVVVQAVYNAREIAVRVRWHDMAAHTTGVNAPTLPVPANEEEQQAPAPPEAAADDFWGEGGAATGQAQAAAAPEFSDAIAVQLPAQAPAGMRRPYFLFGDAQSAVHLWHVDLARRTAQVLVGRGSDNIAPAEGQEVEAVTSYDRGEWSVVFKRQLRPTGAVAFAEEQFVPIAFSVWDGGNRERGNRRALSSWFHLYMTPAAEKSVAGPMIKAALLALGLELLLVAGIRASHSRRRAEPEQRAGAAGALGGRIRTQED